MRNLTIICFLTIALCACESRSSQSLEYIEVDTTHINEMDTINMEWDEELQIGDSISDTPEDIKNMSDDDALDELDKRMTGESLAGEDLEY